MKRKRGITSGKEQISELVMNIAYQCKNLDELEIKLKSHHIECYRRKGDVISGIWLGKRKLRFTTLGVGKIHLQKITLEQKRLNEIQEIKKKRQTQNRKRTQ